MGKPETAIDRHVGERLETAMRIAGVSDAKLAAALGVDCATVAAWLSGEMRINGKALYDAAGLLGVSVGWFFQGFVPGNAGEAIGDTAADGATVH